MIESSTFALIAILATVIKILLIPAYTSTDFEVHRNWLALTHSLPYHQWYFEKTSEWTLDYPPLFAWFEKFWSYFATYVDSAMLDVNNLNYKSDETLYFQRSTVIISDFLLLYSGYKCARLLPSLKQNSEKSVLFMILLAFNCGLFIVDHIHFQYNGFLFGFLFLSLCDLMVGNVIYSALWFSVLLNFKHIFLYIAPAYVVYLLRIYCMDKAKSSWKMLESFQLSRLFSLATVVVCVFCISFGPFATDLGQVLSRLFPFKRGLTHAYWAPNFWALYNAADLVFCMIGKKTGMISKNITISSTSGLVQSVEYSVLPSVPPLLTFVVTFLAMIPCLFDIFFRPKASVKDCNSQFLRAVVLCSLCSFMFGWHVHEKAILMAILPLILLAVQGTIKDAQIFLFLQAVGHYSLFPLLFTNFETMIKICLALLYSLFSFGAFKQIFSQSSSKYLPCLSTMESLYLLGLPLIEMYCTLIHPIYFVESLPFLPLLLISTYCAIGVAWSWLHLYYHALFSQPQSQISMKIKQK